MTFWYDEQYEGETRFGVAVKEYLLQKHSPFQKVEVLDTNSFGRMLVLGGVFMTSEADEFFYHEMIAHPALVVAPRISRVLIIGGGDGGTAREVLRHREVEEVVLVEIDAQVIEASQKYLPHIGTAWDDPRLQVTVGDGVAYVQHAPEGSFDIIILDGCDPVGPAEGLFNLDFYRNCARLLTDGGVFGLQSASPFDQQDIFVQVQHTLADVFEQVHPYFGTVPIYNAGIWSWTLAGRHVQPNSADESRLAYLTPHTKYYNADIHRAAFAQPNFVKSLIHNKRR